MTQLFNNKKGERKMEKKEKDGLIAFDYKSESAKATYDKSS